MNNNAKDLMVLTGGKTNNNDKFKDYAITMGAESMQNQNYVTKEELEKSIDNINQKIDLSIKLMEEKIEKLPVQFENMLLKEREYRDNKAKETNRFIIGTILIGLIGPLISIIALFI